MASSSSQPRHALNGRVMQHSYIEVEYSRLQNLGKKDIDSFLETYDYVTRLRQKDGLQPMPLRDCISDELYEVIYEYNSVEWSAKLEHVPSIEVDSSSATTRSSDAQQDDKIKRESAEEEAKFELVDSLLRQYLEDKLAFESAEEALRALGSVCMNMSYTDLDQRCGEVDVLFNKMLKRMKSLRIRESTLCRKYVETVRPEYLKKDLQSELECEGVTLAVIKGKVRAALVEDYHQHRKSAGAQSPQASPSYAPRARGQAPSPNVQGNIQPRAIVQPQLQAPQVP